MAVQCSPTERFIGLKKMSKICYQSLKKEIKNSIDEHHTSLLKKVKSGDTVDQAFIAKYVNLVYVDFVKLTDSQIIKTNENILIKLGLSKHIGKINCEGDVLSNYNLSNLKLLLAHISSYSYLDDFTDAQSVEEEVNFLASVKNDCYLKLFSKMINNLENHQKDLKSLYLLTVAAITD